LSRVRTPCSISSRLRIRACSGKKERRVSSRCFESTILSGTASERTAGNRSTARLKSPNVIAPDHRLRAPPPSRTSCSSLPSSGTFALRFEAFAQRLREVRLDAQRARRLVPNDLALGLRPDELEHSLAVLVAILSRLEPRLQQREELLCHRNLALVERLSRRRAELGCDDHLVGRAQHDQHRDAVVRDPERAAILLLAHDPSCDTDALRF